MVRKVFHSLFAVFAVTVMMSLTVSADVEKGQKIILKKLKKPCGFNGAELAKKHTQIEWKAVYDSGKLNEELTKLCPSAEPLKEKYIKHVCDFVYNYASDSGNVPS